MGWKSISKDGEERWEGHENPELGGRPVDAGEEGKLAAIIQEDFGHKIIIDLRAGLIFIDPESYEYQNGTLGVSGVKTMLVACDDSNRMHEYKHLTQTFDLARDEKGRKIHDENGKLVKTRTDHLSDLIFRPVWFTRYTNGVPTKAIGLQTTTPKEMGERNVKLIVWLFMDGTIGISS